MDDCTVICLFFKVQSSLIKSKSDTSQIQNSTTEPHFQQGNLATKDDGLESVMACSDVASDHAAHGESPTKLDASTYSHRTGLMVNKRTPT